MNAPFNASDTRHLRRAAKAAKQAEAERGAVVFRIMSDPAGRSFMHSLFLECSIFSTTFTLNALGSAFNEGKRSVGLQLLADVVRWAPDQYLQMMREANDRSSADDRQRGNLEGTRGPDSGRPDDADGPNPGRIDSEYNLFGEDPADGSGEA